MICKWYDDKTNYNNVYIFLLILKNKNRWLQSKTKSEQLQIRQYCASCYPPSIHNNTPSITINQRLTGLLLCYKIIHHLNAISAIYCFMRATDRVSPYRSHNITIMLWIYTIGRLDWSGTLTEDVNLNINQSNRLVIHLTNQRRRTIIIIRIMIVLRSSNHSGPK